MAARFGGRRKVDVARYRLRFLLQEFDLPRGATLIGRSLDCHVTIEDPLVSRQHARIVIDDESVTIEDLGSRNGVKLNGVTLRAPAELKDGDRLRVGTQDLVFCRVDPVGSAHAKTTGVLRLCAACRLPYPREMVACPNCEATEQTEDETLSGSFGTEKRKSWNLQLLVEALERALALGRTLDAERIVRRATVQVEELLAAGMGGPTSSENTRPSGVGSPLALGSSHEPAVDAPQMATLAEAAVRTSLVVGDPAWGSWVAQIYRRTTLIPPSKVIDLFVDLTDKFGQAASPSIIQLVEHLREAARPLSHAEAEGLARLEQLRRLLVAGGASPNDTSDPESTGTLS